MLNALSNRYLLYLILHKVESYLSGGEMHEDIQELHSLLHSGHRVEGRGNHVSHHHLQVLDPRSEPAEIHIKC